MRNLILKKMVRESIKKKLTEIGDTLERPPLKPGEKPRIDTSIAGLLTARDKRGEEADRKIPYTGKKSPEDLENAYWALATALNSAELKANISGDIYPASYGKLPRGYVDRSKRVESVMEMSIKNLTLKKMIREGIIKMLLEADAAFPPSEKMSDEEEETPQIPDLFPPSEKMSDEEEETPPIPDRKLYTGGVSNKKEFDDEDMLNALARADAKDASIQQSIPIEKRGEEETTFSLPVSKYSNRTAANPRSIDYTGDTPASSGTSPTGGMVGGGMKQAGALRTHKNKETGEVKHGVNNYRYTTPVTSTPPNPETGEPAQPGHFWGSVAADRQGVHDERDLARAQFFQDRWSDEVKQLKAAENAARVNFENEPKVGKGARRRRADRQKELELASVRFNRAVPDYSEDLWKKHVEGLKNNEAEARANLAIAKRTGKDTEAAKRAFDIATDSLRKANPAFPDENAEKYIAPIPDPNTPVDPRKVSMRGYYPSDLAGYFKAIEPTDPDPYPLPPEPKRDEYVNGYAGDNEYRIALKNYNTVGRGIKKRTPYGTREEFDKPYNPEYPLIGVGADTDKALRLASWEPFEDRIKKLSPEARNWDLYNADRRDAIYQLKPKYPGKLIIPQELLPYILDKKYDPPTGEPPIPPNKEDYGRDDDDEAMARFVRDMQDYDAKNKEYIKNNQLTSLPQYRQSAAKPKTKPKSKFKTPPEPVAESKHSAAEQARRDAKAREAIKAARGLKGRYQESKTPKSVMDKFLSDNCNFGEEFWSILNEELPVKALKRPPEAPAIAGLVQPDKGSNTKKSRMLMLKHNKLKMEGKTFKVRVPNPNNVKVRGKPIPAQRVVPPKKGQYKRPQNISWQDED